MSSASSSHPADELLLRLVDDDLSAAESGEIGDHVAACAQCRARVGDVQSTLFEYDRFHANVLKPSLPPPPQEWRLPVPRRAVLRFPAKRWLAAAAAVAAGFLILRRFEHPAPVSASELLAKAAVAERAFSPRPGARIRIRKGAST